MLCCVYCQARIPNDKLEDEEIICSNCNGVFIAKGKLKRYMVVFANMDNFINYQEIYALDPAKILEDIIKAGHNCIIIFNEYLESVWKSNVDWFCKL